MVPSGTTWYHYIVAAVQAKREEVDPMAMNLRLDPAHEALLESLAKEERRTKTEIVKLAIEERASKAEKSARTRAIFARIMDEDAELLDELSK